MGLWQRLLLLIAVGRLAEPAAIRFEWQQQFTERQRIRLAFGIRLEFVSTHCNNLTNAKFNNHISERCRTSSP